MPRSWKIPAILSILAFGGHLLAANRANLPSQDGIKFIAIAVEFARQPAWDVIRSADQHPAYPAFVAAAHALVGSYFRTPAQAWLAAAQTVSIVAAIGTLIPLYLLTSKLFRPTTAALAVFLWLLLPVPFTLGHETLADATGLCFAAWAIWLTVQSLGSTAAGPRCVWAAAAGTAAACAYWTRPEGLLVAFSASASLAFFARGGLASRAAGVVPFLAIFLVSAMVYLTINGTVSDRLEAFQAKPATAVRPVAVHALPRGLPEALRDPRYDFSPKDPFLEKTRPGLQAAAWSILRLWSESLGIALAVMTLWGLARTRTRDAAARRLVALHACLLLAVLTLQAAARGYLSSRHVAGLTLISIPFAAAALRLCGLRFAAICRMSAQKRRRGTIAALAGMAAIGVTLHAKPIHASRQPHYQAGQWLKANAPAGSAVFDTRGWAARLANLRRYDPYHFAQAMTDGNTKFWVVESGELASGSRRALTFAAILADGGYQEAVFRRKPGRESDSDVLVFSWRRPDWWERPPIPAHPRSDSPSDPKADPHLRQASQNSQEGGR